MSSWPINQFRVDEPGGQAHKYVVPDIVLFVNGIPLVVIECKSPYITDPAVEAIDQLQRYANQRTRVHDDEGNERLFHFNQFVVATYFDKAMVGTFTSEGEHFAEWKETEPVSRDAVATELGKPPARTVQPRDSGGGNAAARTPAGHRAELHPADADRGP